MSSRANTLESNETSNSLFRGHESTFTPFPSIASLHSEVALVTRESSGLVRATVIAYAAAGAYIVCADLNPFPPEPHPGLHPLLH